MLQGAVLTAVTTQSGASYCCVPQLISSLLILSPGTNGL